MKKKFNSIILLLITLLLLVGCQKETTVMVVEKEVPVGIIKANKSTYTKTITLPGVLTNDEEIIYRFKMSGKIEDILVNSGQMVTKGDVLARLDAKDYEELLEISRLKVESTKAKYQSANNDLLKTKANYEKAKKDFENIETLYRSNAVSKNEYENAELLFNISIEEYNSNKNGSIILAKSNYDSALASYEMTKNQFSNGELRSTFDGYVKKIFIKEGNQINKNDPVVSIGSINAQVTIGLSAEEKQNVKLGDNVEIVYGTKSIQGQVESISDVLDSKTLLYKVEISIQENDIPAYSIVKVNINIGDQNAIKIPIKAILNDGVPFVYVVKNEHAVKKNIDLLGYEKEYVFINGVNNNESIIVVGNKTLRGGERVIIK